MCERKKYGNDKIVALEKEIARLEVRKLDPYNQYGLAQQNLDSQIEHCKGCIAQIKRVWL